MAKGRGIKNNNVLYKDMFVMLAKFGEVEEEETNNIYDSKKKRIARIDDEHIKETIKNLKQCETDKEVCDYLVESGIIDTYYEDTDMAFLGLFVRNDEETICENCLELLKFIPERSKNKAINEDERVYRIGNMIGIVDNPLHEEDEEDADTEDTEDDVE